MWKAIKKFFNLFKRKEVEVTNHIMSFKTKDGKTYSIPGKGSKLKLVKNKDGSYSIKEFKRVDVDF